MPSDYTDLHAELDALVDRLIFFYQARKLPVAEAYSRCAEALLVHMYAPAADAISLAASRKGMGDVLANKIVPHLDGAGAAAAVTILMFRGARRPVVTAISNAFTANPEFHQVQRRLCRRVLRP